jgi:hypothetical protein
MENMAEIDEIGNESDGEDSEIMAITKTESLETTGYDAIDGSVPNIDDFDVNAFLNRVRSDPVVAKAMVQKLNQWERELFGERENGNSHEDPEPCETTPDISPSTPPPPEPPPGSLLSELARPPSPTDICDFPYFDIENDDRDFKLKPTTTKLLPRFQVNRTELETYTNYVHQTQENLDDWDDSECRVSKVTTYSIVADIGTFGKTFKVCKAVKSRGDLADSGANCCMTANLAALSEVTKLVHPIIVGLAVTDDGKVSSTQQSVRTWASSVYGATMDT